MYIYTDYLVICHGLPVRSRILLLTCARNFVKVSVIHIQYASCACVKGLMAASSSVVKISALSLSWAFILCFSAKVIWFCCNKKGTFCSWLQIFVTIFCVLLKTDHMYLHPSCLYVLSVEFGQGKSFRSRTLFIDMCQQVLVIFSRSFFKENFYESILELSSDPVPNIRLR